MGFILEKFLEKAYLRNVNFTLFVVLVRAFEYLNWIVNNAFAICFNVSIGNV